jgi:preprotein translocase subunit SecB
MADTPTPPASPSPSPAGGDGQPRQRAVPMMVKAQYVKDLSFENPRAPNPLPAGVQPTMKVEIDLSTTPKGGDDHEVVLSLTVTATHQGETLFIVEVHYAGLIAISGLPDNLRDTLLWIEGGRLLFPFARAVIANATRDGGLPPVLLAPVDFMALYQQKTGRSPFPQVQQQAAPTGTPAGTA